MPKPQSSECTMPPLLLAIIVCTQISPGRHNHKLTSARNVECTLNMCHLRRSSDTKPATGTKKKKENAKALTALGLFVHAIHSI